MSLIQKNISKGHFSENSMPLKSPSAFSAIVCCLLLQLIVPSMESAWLIFYTDSQLIICNYK